MAELFVRYMFTLHCYLTCVFSCRSKRGPSKHVPLSCMFS